MTLPLTILLWCLALSAVAGTIAIVSAIAGVSFERWTEAIKKREDMHAEQWDKGLQSLKAFLSNQTPKDKRALSIFCRLLDSAGGTLRISRHDIDKTAAGLTV